MPVYTYRCQRCGVEFEKTQTFFARPLRRCPECRTGIVRRVPQLPAIVFKGSGWYSTDHRSASGQARTLAEENDTAKHATDAKGGS